MSIIFDQILFTLQKSTYIKYDNGKRLLSQSPDSLHGILVDKCDKEKFTTKLTNFKTLEEYLIKRNDTAEEAGPLELCMDLLKDDQVIYSRFDCSPGLN